MKTTYARKSLLFLVWFQRVRVHGSKVEAVGNYGGWSRKLGVHTMNHKHESDRRRERREGDGGERERVHEHSENGVKL